MKMEFTKEEKEKALLATGWDKLTGYPMEYGAPEADNIVVTIEEVRKWIGEPAQDFWAPKESDWDFLRNLDDAWDCFIDELYNSLDTEDELIVEEYINHCIKKSIEG